MANLIQLYVVILVMSICLIIIVCALGLKNLLAIIKNLEARFRNVLARSKNSLGLGRQMMLQWYVQFPSTHTLVETIWIDIHPSGRVNRAVSVHKETNSQSL
jgi:hypothetical protein